ncbi:MAG: hypothetical protein R3F19_35150 [Verrucomicrobiales bacterium]
MKRFFENEYNRFERLCQGFGMSDSDATLAWSNLLKHYTEPHRHYHTFEHVGAMLTALDCIAGTLPIDERGLALIEMAIWFHDAIYDPRLSTNEEDSAELFLQLVGASMSEAESQTVARLILATDPRRSRNDVEDEKVMVDIDLLVLAADAPGYRAYTAAIRKEYAHVPQDAFAKGRSAVLFGILAKPIYLTEHFADREKLARANLEREIGELQGR